MKFTASLVTYRHPLAEIRALVESVLAAKPLRFYIVDNASDAELADSLAREFPSVEYVAAENRGFGAGHNIAIRRAMDAGADVHFVVNPDISFEAGTLEAIVGFMERTPDVGMLMPNTVGEDGMMQRNCKLVPGPFDLIFRRFLPRSWIRRRTARFEMHSADMTKVMDVPYLCGCFLAFRIAALRDIGLFDERFFMYPEDIDITRRMYSSGKWRSVFFPGATVVHAHAAASYASFRMLAIHCANMVRYFNKWGWVFDAERRRINREVERSLRLSGERP